MRRLTVLPLFLAAVSVCFAQAGPAPLPPMGWNSWNHFAAKVTDADVRSAADQLVSSGMKAAGYVYVNVDDTWQGERDAQGVLHPNNRFPDMKALGDYIHSRGLKFGIYSSPGPKTCGGFAGSFGHEAQDAKMYAAWGVDFLKYDLCSMQDEMRRLDQEHGGDRAASDKLMIDAFRKMGDALKATGRPILYSLCQYGVAKPWIWGPSVGAQMWRTTDDIDDSYGRMIAIGTSQAGLAKYAGPNRWNDPDMLEVGNGKMSFDEYKTHMSLWVMLASPLLAGNDLSRMSPADKSLLMNREAIAIDQDKLAKQADRVSLSGDFEIWTKPLTGGRIAILMVNRSWDLRNVSFEMREVGFPAGLNLHDVWADKDLGHKTGVFTSAIPKHGAMLLIGTK
jgi:alpha-galactosidase